MHRTKIGMLVLDPRPDVNGIPMGRPTIEFREQVTVADAAAVESIVRSTGVFSREEVRVAVELVQETLTKGADSGYKFKFAELGCVIAGYTCFGRIPCTLFSYDLYWIAVAASHQGTGVGGELLRRTERAIATAGGRRLYVETSSRRQYQVARAFYQRSGYEEGAVLEDFYAPGDHKVILVKVLQPAE